MNAQRKKTVQRRATQKKAQPKVGASGNDIQNTNNSENVEMNDAIETAAPAIDTTPAPIEIPKPKETVAKPLPTTRERRSKGGRRHTASGNKLVAPIWAQEWAEANGLVLRYVNDPSGTRQRLTDMEADDWDLVRAPDGKDNKPGTITADEAGPDSALVSRSVDRATGEKAYLMCKPREWYDEDQKEKTDRIRDAEQAQKRGDDVRRATTSPADKNGTVYGSIEASR